MDLDRDNVKDLISVGSDNVLRVSRIGMAGAGMASHSHVIHAEEFLRKRLVSEISEDMGEVLALGAGCCYRRESDMDNFIAVVDQGRVKGKGIVLELLDSSLMTLWQKEVLTEDDCQYQANTRIVSRPVQRGEEGEEEVTLVLVALHRTSTSSPSSSDRLNATQCAGPKLLLKAFNVQSGEELWQYAPSKGKDKGKGEGEGDSESSAARLSHLRFGNHPFYDRVQRALHSMQSQSREGGVGSDSGDWSKYRSSLMHQLPHLWRDERDDKLLLAYFNKGEGRRGGGGRGGVLGREPETALPLPTTTSTTTSREYGKRAGVRHIEDSSSPGNKNKKGRNDNGKPMPSPATMPTMTKATSTSSNKKTKRSKGVMKVEVSSLLGSGARADAQTHNSSTSSTSSSPHDGRHPHSHLLHGALTNAVVFHSEEGIAVISLQTGDLIAALPLRRDVFYADVNSDGNIDSLYFDNEADFRITSEEAEEGRGGGRVRLSIEEVKTTMERAKENKNKDKNGDKDKDEDKDGNEDMDGNEDKDGDKVRNGDKDGDPSSERRADMCSFVVLSGMPPHSFLFNDSSQLCASDNSYRKYHSRSARRRRDTIARDGSKADIGTGGRVLSVPLLLKQRRTRPRHHSESNPAMGMGMGMGRGAVEGESEQLDQHLKALASLYGAEGGGGSSDVTPQNHYREEVLIVANNLGVVNAYNRYGRLLWQQTDSSSAQREAEYAERLRPMTSAAAMSRPSLQQMSAIATSASSAPPSEHLLLYCHRRRMRLHSLLHPRDRGKVVAEAQTPNDVMHKPLVVDFDDDGVHDLIVVTDVAILGYRLSITPTFFPLVIPFLILFVIALAIFALKLSSESTATASSSNAGIETPRGGTGTGTGKRKKQWTLTRATDSQHLD